VSERLCVFLLGPVEARVDGEVVALPGTTLPALLARLALAPDRVVPVPVLIDLLWADDPPAEAVGNLQSYVSRLRRALGAERIVRQAGGYRLRLAPSDVDVGRVAELVEQARAADRAVAADLLCEALELWRGGPFADVAENLAFAPESARLGEWRVQLLGDWLEVRLGLGPPAETLPELERAARSHPARERLQLLLMRGLHADGRTGEALAVADRYRRRLADESGLDPGPELAGLVQRLLADDAELRAPPSAPRRWHAPRDRFVGRDDDLDRLRTAAATPGLVTVTGPGGVGKTRLVLELLDDLSEADGTCVAALGEVPEAGDVAAVVAAALGLLAAPDGAAAALADRIGAQPATLVLDNCEHVAVAVRALAAQLMARCPRLRIVATSRQRLGVPGERVLRLGPLDPAEQVALFCDRAALLRADFSAPDPGLVEQVCALVDGLPLGVELAARREAVFGLAQLWERLAGGLSVLDPATGGDRSTALAATVEWSYRLLDPNARALFDRLVVCRGGFGLDALAHLAPSGNPPALLAQLVEASMVVADLDVDPPRYRVLETMRHVGLGHLDTALLCEARDAHARWMQAHIDAVRVLQDERAPGAMPLLRRERANLAEALVRLVERGAWQRAGRLGVALAVAVSDDPHLELLAQLTRLAAVPDRAGGDGGLCLVAAGAAAWLTGDAGTAVQLLSAALDRLPRRHPQRWTGLWFRAMSHIYAGDLAAVLTDTADLLATGDAPAWVRATAVCNAALMCLFTGDRRAAQAWLDAHHGLLAEVGAVDGFVAYTRGELAAGLDPVRALSWFELAHRQNDERGDSFNRDVAAIGRAAVLLRLGRHREAASALRSLLEPLSRAGMWPQIWITVRLTAELLADLDDPAPAAALLAAADHDPLAPPILAADRERYNRLWRQVGEYLVPGVPAGRVEAVRQARAALDRHF
jgi:predicted ATPase/DNA-binding SARP family transcriptional activator